MNTAAGFQSFQKFEPRFEPGQNVETAMARRLGPGGAAEGRVARLRQLALQQGADALEAGARSPSQ